jgi:ABC-type lipoprotein export system ATPase subunit
MCSNTVNLEVHRGEMIGLRGPSGAGKSTLVNMITGIDRPTSGEVLVAGERLEKITENQLARHRGEFIGVVFQFFQLLPTLTIVENVLLPMDFSRKWTPRQRYERAMTLLEQMDVADQAPKLPRPLGWHTARRHRPRPGKRSTAVVADYPQLTG